MKECIMFVLAMFYDEQLYHKPCKMTLHEARVNLDEYVETDYLDVPDTLSPRLYMEIWNSFCNALDS